MALILNIETSSRQCSVCVAGDGEILFGLESKKEMDSAASLAPFTDKCMKFIRERNHKLDAVSVSNGPGSYTGLRIGLSLAKGIAYGLDIPLITLSSLEIMAVKAMFSYPEISGEEIIVPMMDARRMEVYTAAYNCSLDEIIKGQPMILNEESFIELHNKGKILFLGDGAEKFKNLYQGRNAEWLKEGMPHVKYMVSLSEKYFREKRFADVAYAVPNYLKDYRTTQPKPKII